MKITILTPTYNRGNIGLRSLYESLKEQTVRDFEWLIVDDGSTDSTKEIIETFIEKSDFIIRYIYKPNGGKHTALNVGIAAIESELTFIVDSDDKLTEDAVETVLWYHERYYGKKTICGYTFLRADLNGKINGKTFSPNEKIDSYINVRINGNDTFADKAEVFFTKCLQEFPFPEYNGEKFLGEDIVWIRMARKYDMVHINKIIYIGEYEKEGLTKNRKLHNIHSPIGCMERAKEFMKKDIRFRYRLKGVISYIVYGKFAKRNFYNLMKYTDHKLLTLLFYPVGLFIYWKWNGKYKKG